MLALVLVIGCGTSPIDSPNSDTVSPETTFTSAQEAIAHIKANASVDTIPAVFAAPSSGVWGVRTMASNQTGGQMRFMVPGVSTPTGFSVQPGSMTMDGQRVSEALISMKLTLDVVVTDSGEKLNSMNYEFGPSGLQFSPQAQLYIPFDVLVGLDVDTLQLESESEGSLENVTYSINESAQYLIATVPHFSQYYLKRR